MKDNPFKASVAFNLPTKVPKVRLIFVSRIEQKPPDPALRRFALYIQDLDVLSALEAWLISLHLGHQRSAGWWLSGDFVGYGQEL